METLILPNRSVLVLEGPDTLALLERLVTCNTQTWQPGEARYGALLAPQGKLIADFIAHRTETGALLDVATNAVGDLSNRLKMFRLRAKVEIGVDGKQAVAIGGDFPPDPRSADLPSRGTVATGAPQEMKAEDWDALAIGAGVAEWGRDFQGAEVFPWEINMDRMGGVDLKKGCFVGQEVVSRTHRRGKVRKRTFILEGENLDAGQEVSVGNSVGEITSAAGGKALARLRVDRLVKALSDGEQPSVNGAPVKLITPDWLSDEMTASSGDGDEPLT
ncbi:MAG: folate-binding protein [Henriciella sp.]|uniref:CAF17-like 4Fe-4S cluster assembly/insertion protein YgfZ n=1 Tax=Henriciella sp. TaxID=1968823 RepID=UPI003C772844